MRPTNCRQCRRKEKIPKLGKKGLWSMCAIVSGRWGPTAAYDVRLTVCMRPCFLPFVRLPVRAGAPLDFDLVTAEALDRFMTDSSKLRAEMEQIVDVVLREWRLPTMAEDRRIAELLQEFEIVSAIFELPLTNKQ